MLCYVTMFNFIYDLHIGVYIDSEGHQNEIYGLKYIYMYIIQRKKYLNVQY